MRIMKNFNYVILGSSWDLYKYAYSDLNSLDNAIYISDTTLTSNIVRRIHLSKSINAIFELPFKKIWNKFIFKSKFQNDNPICFVFFSNWAEYNKELNLTDYFKKRYKGSKCVLFLQDLYKFRIIDTKQFDLCLSFDKADCERYGFVYHPLVFSDIKFDNEVKVENDVFFLGKAKNRLRNIVRMFEYLQNYGLKCDFYLVGVNKEDQVYPDLIHYIEGMDYLTNLQLVRKSRCLLEIMQESGTGFTQRGCEAVCLGKKLLTNNQYINEEPFFNPRYISTFKSVDDIDRDFINHIPDEISIDYHYKHMMSPIELLQFIENRIL